MLERPDVGDDTIIRALEIAYPINIRELHFLPIGLDPAASVFRVELADDRAVLLKLKTRSFTPASLKVPFLLHAQGLHNVVAPSQTHEKELSLSIGSQRFAALYPWIEGQTAFEEGLDEGQSSQLGEWLHRMHATHLPEEIIHLTTGETFRSPHAEPLRTLSRSIAAQGCGGTAAHKELVKFWNRKATQIVDLLVRCEEIGWIAQAQNAPQTLCHADIHLDNVLVDTAGELQVIDWDEVCRAPI